LTTRGCHSPPIITPTSWYLEVFGAPGAASLLGRRLCNCCRHRHVLPLGGVLYCRICVLCTRLHTSHKYLTPMRYLKVDRLKRLIDGLLPFSGRDWQVLLANCVTDHPLCLDHNEVGGSMSAHLMFRTFRCLWMVQECQPRHTERRMAGNGMQRTRIGPM
jgi:hypothetical protein